MITLHQPHGDYVLMSGMAIPVQDLWTPQSEVMPVFVGLEVCLARAPPYQKKRVCPSAIAGRGRAEGHPNLLSLNLSSLSSWGLCWHPFSPSEPHSPGSQGGHFMRVSVEAGIQAYLSKMHFCVTCLKYLKTWYSFSGRSCLEHMINLVSNSSEITWV